MNLSLEVPNKVRSPDPVPEDLTPQLALLSDSIPQSSDYIHELKLDGYRTLTVVKNGVVQYFTRSGLDWSKKYNSFDKDLRQLKIRSAVFDGEIIALNSEGHSDFSALQSALKTGDLSKCQFSVFDLLYVNGMDLRCRPLRERKSILKKILGRRKNSAVKYHDHVSDGASGTALFEMAAAQGLEGIVSKNQNALYTAGRSAAWQKIKTSKRQELVIGGFTDPEGTRIGIGALLMGVYEGGQLRYVGRVGTGFSAANTPELLAKLKRLKNSRSPFEIDTPKGGSKIHWLTPKLVAEIEFKAWTADGILRHASFLGLRKDKRAKQVLAETPAISHPERVVYPSTNVTKLDVANYYKSVAPWMLPHLQDRPLSLLRCPSDVTAACFFQKHVDLKSMTALLETQIRNQTAVSLQSEEGLLQLVQWGVIEPHTWQCHIQTALHPDQMILDLDPDARVTWAQVCKTALALKDLLERLHLKSFVKTTGGKGLHIHVPIAPIYTWEQVKEFSKTLCQHLVDEYPDQYTVNLSKKTRTNKIFLDYLRNGFGATAVAPYALRARAQPCVAVPIHWRELSTISGGDAFDLHSTLKRLARQKKDPWAGYLGLQQEISILHS